MQLELCKANLMYAAGPLFKSNTALTSFLTQLTSASAFVEFLVGNICHISVTDARSITAGQPNYRQTQ